MSYHVTKTNNGKTERVKLNKKGITIVRDEIYKVSNFGNNIVHIDRNDKINEILSERRNAVRRNKIYAHSDKIYNFKTPSVCIFEKYTSMHITKNKIVGTPFFHQFINADVMCVVHRTGVDLFLTCKDNTIDMGIIQMHITNKKLKELEF